ncbi:hypothetical protein F5144DRAFT_290897 [Chaetomium tenue]|uniref:Uncharacterized protein n=1 Tax=Chaetomium tenue TaxID=1854479 RepID=A0ACB7P7P1_9PEZI|nr:hypothetical protein F5144DRAFT_290897 [Chaetomium globosum]
MSESNQPHGSVAWAFFPVRRRQVSRDVSPIVAQPVSLCKLRLDVRLRHGPSRRLASFPLVKSPCFEWPLCRVMFQEGSPPLWPPSTMACTAWYGMAAASPRVVAVEERVNRGCASDECPAGAVAVRFRRRPVSDRDGVWLRRPDRGHLLLPAAIAADLPHASRPLFRVGSAMPGMFEPCMASSCAARRGPSGGVFRLRNGSSAGSVRPGHHTVQVIEMLILQHHNAAMTPSTVRNTINSQQTLKGRHEQIVPILQLKLNPSFCCHHSALFFAKASSDVCQAVGPARRSRSPVANPKCEHTGLNFGHLAGEVLEPCRTSFPFPIRSSFLVGDQ